MESSYIWEQVITDQDGNQERRRQGHLMSMFVLVQRYAFGGKPLPKPRINPKFFESIVATYLAWRDIEERRRDILPNLPELMGPDCDFHWSFGVRDSSASRSQCLRILQDLLMEWGGQSELADTPASNMDDSQTKATAFDFDFDDKELISAPPQEPKQLPFAIMGPLFPIEGQAVSEIAGAVMGMVHMSGTSRSTQLDGTPLFARTAASNVPVGDALIRYLSHLNVTRVANIFPVSDEFSTISYLLGKTAARYNIDFRRLAFNSNDPESMEEAMVQLKESDIRYVIGLSPGRLFTAIAEAASKIGVMGTPSHVWIWHGRAELLAPDFEFDRETQANVAQAFHGVGISVSAVPPHPNFNKVYEQFTKSREEQQHFLSLLSPADRVFFQNYTFQPTYRYHPHHLMTYDAVIALGLAACHTPGNFTGSQLHAHILNSTFQGITGKIYFDPNTGSRPMEPIAIQNIVLSDTRSDTATLRFDTRNVAVIRGEEVTLLEDRFMYNDNSTVAPSDHPPAEVDYNLIPRGVQIFGVSLAGIIILGSLGLMIWTILNRKKFVISASQPVFLLQLCVGCVILAASIIPLSFQGETPSPKLDAACMSFGWLYCLGLVTAISAILSKTWRLGQLLDGSQGMKRVKVESRDVAKPFAVLLIWNVSLLSACTVVSPLQYQRNTVDHNVDEYGRPTESYGFCGPSNDWVFLFAGLVFAANICAVIFASVQLYRVRNMSTYFSETTSLLWSMASLCESTIIFTPLLLAMRSSPTALYIGISVLITVTCLSFLVPIFGKKIANRNAQYRDAKEDEKRVKDRSLLSTALDAQGGNIESDMSGTMRLKRHSSGQKSAENSNRSKGFSISSAAERSRALWNSNFTTTE